MRLLLDQGLSRSTVLHLRNAGIEAVHVGDRGLSTASDAKILDVGRQEQDRGHVGCRLPFADFHSLLVLSGAAGPSVIRIRIEGLRAKDLVGLLVNVLEVCNDDLMKGAMVSVTENGVRVRRLPLLRWAKPANKLLTKWGHSGLFPGTKPTESPGKINYLSFPTGLKNLHSWVRIPPALSRYRGPAGEMSSQCLGV